MSESRRRGPVTVLVNSKRRLVQPPLRVLNAYWHGYVRPSLAQPGHRTSSRPCTAPTRAFVRSWNSAPAAPSPACTAAAATPAAAASPAATPNRAATASSTTPAANPGHLHVAANVFLIEEMERSQADVGHFLVAKNEALIGRDIVRLGDIGGWHRGCRRTPHQRKTQSRGTQCRHRGGVGRALPFRSLLHLLHGRILRVLVFSGKRPW
jgi:hypothetical protein